MRKHPPQNNHFVQKEAGLANQAFGFILTALFLAAASYAILATRALPRWTGWLGVGAAVLPPGFYITTVAYRRFVMANELQEKILSAVLAICALPGGTESNEALL